FVSDNSFVVAAEVVKGGSKIVVDKTKIASEIIRSTVCVDSFFEAPQLIKDSAEVVDRIHIVWRDANRLLIIQQGFLVAVEYAVWIAAIEPCLGVGWISVGRFFEDGDRLFLIAV